MHRQRQRLENLFAHKNVFIIISIVSSVQATEFTTVGSNVTLPCSLNVDYPSWSDVSNSVSYNFAGYFNFQSNIGDKVGRLAWASDKRGLIIQSARFTDTGQYQCYFYTNNNEFVSLEVRGALQRPEILNTEPQGLGSIVRGTENTPLTLTCISRRGRPQPTVTWRQGSLSSTPLLPITTTTTTEMDSTITVTTTYTFTPTRTNDLAQYYCRVTYNSAPTSAESASVILHLNLQPSTPTLTITSPPVPDGQQNVHIGQCSTSGFRPRDGVSLSWTVGGATVNGTGTINNGPGETFNYTGSLTKSVTKQDNGQVTCTVKHGTLSTPLSATGNLNVTFAPMNATLIGNTSILANGINRLPLTCTTATANPPATISWSRNGSSIDNTNPVQETAGDYGGKKTSQVLELRPTRDDDGDVYICTASNTVNTRPPVASAQKVLDLKYHPIVTSITGPISPVTEGQTSNNVFRCNVSSNPRATVTWFHGNIKVHESTRPDSGTVYSYTIPVINRTHDGLYRCVANNNILPNGQGNVSVTVYYHPIVTSITGPTSPVTEGQTSNNVFRCNVSSNPSATVTWYHDNAKVHESASPVIGTVYSYTIPVINRTHDGLYRCVANNNIQPNGRGNVSVTVFYIPEIAITKAPSDVTECTNGLILTCTVSSKPVSNITWYRGQTSLLMTEGINVLQYTIMNIDRNMSRRYRCVANNGYGGVVQEIVNLTVKYTPDVLLITRNVTTHNQSVDILCKPSGVPDTYVFSPWTHRWDTNGPLLNHPGLGNSSELTLTNLTYEHSGLYTCIVSNGVNCSKNQDAGTGHVNLIVQAAPVLIDPQPINNGRIHVASTINRPAVFNFTFWSNADNTAVTCYRNINGIRQNTPVGNTVFTQTTVLLPVFSSSIVTTGELASLSLKIQHVDDFGSYDVVLLNQIGKGKLLAINVVAQGPPQTPVLQSVSVLSPTEVSVNWTRGFHGGLDQTIVIQISTDEAHWENKTEVIDGMRNEPESSFTHLQGLSPSSLYYIRLLAYNGEGISENYTKVLSFKTYSEDHPSSSPVAAIVGGIAGSLVAMIIVVVVLIVLKRRNIIGGKSQDTELVRTQNEESRSQSEDEEIVENMMYVSANEVPSQSTSGQSVDTSAIYSRPVKPGKHIVAGSGDVYAVVSKPKKQGVEETKKVSEMPKKKEKGKKVDKKKGKIAKKSGGGDVYENAPEEATAAANNENIYESTETSPPPKPSRRPNKDGLLYADIEFKSTPSSNGTAVIHGLDDRTLYSDIDFNKEAEPLPESDEENDKPK